MRLLAVVVLASGCATAVDDRPRPPEPLGPYVDETGERVPQAGTARLRDTTVILPASVSKHIVVNFDHLLVLADGNEDLLELSPNAVLVSGTGDGFIRRAYAVTLEGDMIRIATVPATLADAVVEASFHATSDEPFVVEQRIDSTIPEIGATILGRATISPTIDIELTLADNELRAFELRATGAGSAEIEGSLTYTGSTHWAWGEEAPWDKILSRRIYALGPLPVVVVARASATIAASAYVEEPVNFASGVLSTLTVDAQSHYAAGHWSSFDASAFAFTRITPRHEGKGMASLSVGITPRIELAFYGIAGPRIELATQAGGYGAYCGSTLQTAQQVAMIGAATMRLEALAKTPNANVVLFDNRVPFDDVGECAE